MKVNLYGASGHATVIMDIAKSVGFEIDTIYDDDLNVDNIGGVLVSHSLERRDDWIISIGSNPVRKMIVEKHKFGYAKLVHSFAVVSDNVKIDEGTVIMAGGIINSGTSIGKHVIVNTNSSIDHDCVLEDFVHISPGATLCGHIKVGEGSHVGAGAVVIPGINIGKWAVIGAGAVIINDIPDGAKVVGNPGRIIEM